MSQMQSLSKALSESVVSFVNSDLDADAKIAGVRETFEQFAKALDMAFEPVTEVQKAAGATSFSESFEAMQARTAISEAMKPLYLAVAALQDSVVSVISDPTIADKGAAIADTVTQFDQQMDGLVQQLTGTNPDAEQDPNADPNQQQMGQEGGPATVEAPEEQPQQVDGAQGADAQEADRQNGQTTQAAPSQPTQGGEQGDAKGDEEEEKKPFGKSDQVESFAKRFAPDIQEVYDTLRKGADAEGDDDAILVSKQFLSNAAIVIDQLYGESIANEQAVRVTKAAADGLAMLRAHHSLMGAQLDDMEGAHEISDAESEGTPTEAYDDGIFSAGGDTDMSDAKVNKNDDAVDTARIVQEALAKALAPVMEQLTKKDEVISTLTKRLEKIEAQPKSGGPALNSSAPIALAKSDPNVLTFKPRDTDTGQTDPVELMKTAQGAPVFRPQR